MSEKMLIHPCPFCGKQPKFVPSDPDVSDGTGLVQCRNLDCPIGHNMEPVFASAWNTRHAGAEGEAKFYRETLEQICQDSRKTRARRLAESALLFWDSMAHESPATGEEIEGNTFHQQAKQFAELLPNQPTKEEK